MKPPCTVCQRHTPFHKLGYFALEEDGRTIIVDDICPTCRNYIHTNPTSPLIALLFARDTFLNLVPSPTIPAKEVESFYRAKSRQRHLIEHQIHNFAKQRVNAWNRFVRKVGVCKKYQDYFEDYLTRTMNYNVSIMSVQMFEDAYNKLMDYMPNI